MRFGILGVGGYVARKHMEAITTVGGQIVAACDLSDSVGQLDRYAPRCMFTTRDEVFWQDHIHEIDTVVLCTPSWQHIGQAITALKNGKNVVIEKPLALSHESGSRFITDIQQYTGRVYPVVQLRYHPEVATLRTAIDGHCTTLDIDYVVCRGPWYDESWKGQSKLSGGILVNIGIHLFDLAVYLTGNVVDIEAAEVALHEAHGVFKTEHARVTWRLAIVDDPAAVHRRFTVGPVSLDVSDKMSNLHKEVYRRVVSDEKGCDVASVIKSLHLIDAIKTFNIQHD
ncbi:MAG: hypothetical protein A2583_03245 [Bdellovibrionales bacterium RIFOXYD1_FULL_53_11]|nr:MAG: hypothetical protein A2583_03245 [Bdellovibrionales bacterium RIFOXYD1_FULL_53_11]